MTPRSSATCPPFTRHNATVNGNNLTRAPCSIYSNLKPIPPHSPRRLPPPKPPDRTLPESQPFATLHPSLRNVQNATKLDGMGRDFQRLIPSNKTKNALKM